eukprot:11371411-Alexandrium_andersonii.AAC.1
MHPRAGAVGRPVLRPVGGGACHARALCRCGGQGGWPREAALGGAAQRDAARGARSRPRTRPSGRGHR